MYGTTEEMFFVNWDMGGNYCGQNPTKLLSEVSANTVRLKRLKIGIHPSSLFREAKTLECQLVKGLEAFNAAQLKGIKSKLLYFPEENHWVLSPQNALIWQREFFKWLKETL